jgi:hypothetical protein
MVFVLELQALKKMVKNKIITFINFIYYYSTISNSSISNTKVDEGGIKYSPFLGSVETPAVA